MVVGGGAQTAGKLGAGLLEIPENAISVQAHTIGYVFGKVDVDATVLRAPDPGTS